MSEDLKHSTVCGGLSTRLWLEGEPWEWRPDVSWAQGGRTTSLEEPGRERERERRVGGQKKWERAGSQSRQ